jgi:hypothetical protein
MVVFCIGFFNTDSHAGTVRTTYSDGVAMLPVNLKMGQSTVLRFVEKPRKVVIGNSNYYSVEFIDNDLAIQPLGAVTTNLFVYGVKNIYGFILKTNQAGNYDDLVQVDLKENKFNSQTKMTVRASPLKEVSRPRVSFQVGGDLKITLMRVQKYERKVFYVMDFQLENISKTEIDLSKTEMVLSRGKIKLSPQEFIYREIKLKPGEITNARGFATINKKTEMSIEVRLQKIKARQIILGRFL